MNPWGGLRNSKLTASLRAQEADTGDTSLLCPTAGSEPFLSDRCAVGQEITGRFGVSRAPKVRYLGCLGSLCYCLIYAFTLLTPVHKAGSPQLVLFAMSPWHRKFALNAACLGHLLKREPTPHTPVLVSPPFPSPHVSSCLPSSSLVFQFAPHLSP